MWLEKQRKYPKNICSRLMLAILLLASVITLTACRSSNIKETTKQTDHKTKKWKPLVITKREKAQAQKEVKQISDICQNIKINENKVTKKDLQMLYDTSQRGKNFRELKICGHGTILALLSPLQL